MTTKIEVLTTISDPRAAVKKKKLSSRGFALDAVSIVDAYALDMNLSPTQAEQIAALLAHPVIERSAVNQPLAPEHFDWAIEVGYLPGVTDNIGSTVRQSIEDVGIELAPHEQVYSSQILFISGNLSQETVAALAQQIANPLIQKTTIRSVGEYMQNNGMGTIVPRVALTAVPNATLVDILHATETELTTIGKQGIRNYDGTRRGPLALDLTYMKAIQQYFETQKRNPTDVELESIAQTWSEHCRHTIFADPIDELTNGLFKSYIRRATEKIRKQKGKKDSCVSVFTDNSGAIIFDDNYLITHKVETHNSPSALDPFGGAITGIVGVNRDTIGFGLGALPIINIYGFCFGEPSDERPLYKGPDFTHKMLSSKRIMEGVIEGVKVGGNCSGIPTPQGFVYFDEGYRGKPLVFVGTVGLIPKESAGRPSHEKQAQPGDYIVMVGGRVGMDGIHGATFSSEAMDTGSPATAVQIGDPITQKILSDALVKEARDLGLYRSITDNGAGGLSCSVAEMAKESGGCSVTLEKVPVKYQGLAPWQIWISESQERMTLAVPPENWEAFSTLMKKRGVEATIIGEFTASGKCTVAHNDNTVMDLDLHFLHNGMPARPMQTRNVPVPQEEPSIALPTDMTASFHAMLSRYNTAGFEFISQQYDHEVQAGSVLKPLQGRGRINGDATVTKPVLNSLKGIVLSQGITPSYSDLDPYHMAANALDTAIRNAIAVGAPLDKIHLLDNFCWCSSNEPERLWQLKQAGQALYEIAVAYGTPFISGKDSMFNDFKGYDEQGNPIKISVPPTLLVSSITVINDVRKVVSLDAKFPGDLVYVLGETFQELGGSEYFAMVGEQERGRKIIGKTAPWVDPERNKKLYKAVAASIEEGLIASCQSVHRGGIALALAKTAMGGYLGMDVSLENLPDIFFRDDFRLYSESAGRYIVTVAPANRERFEAQLKRNVFAEIGTVREDKHFTIKGIETEIQTTIDAMLEVYRKPFQGF